MSVLSTFTVFHISNQIWSYSRKANIVLSTFVTHFCLFKKVVCSHRTRASYLLETDRNLIYFAFFWLEIFKILSK